ncbi:hypothetical protein DTO217A2_2414 [Paecilomyces variotii]|nr:hypothetical protein DTO217A2_2414 [Paecilomyces variotii]
MSCGVSQVIDSKVGNILNLVFFLRFLCQKHSSSERILLSCVCEPQDALCGQITVLHNAAAANDIDSKRPPENQLLDLVHAFAKITTDVLVLGSAWLYV